LATVVLLLSLFHSALVPAGQPVETGRILATVTTLEGTVHMSGVQLELRTSTDATVLAKTMTDGAGLVTFPDVPPGRYVIQATRPGFVSNDSAIFDVRAGEVAQVLIDIRLTFVMPEIEVRAETPSPTDSVQPVSMSDMLAGSVLEIAPLEGDDFQSLLLLLPGLIHAQSALRAGVAREKPRGAARTAVVDMAAIASECVDVALARHHLHPGSIQLESHEGRGLAVRGDAEELRTVITNLLDNAVKYSGSDVRVTVAVASPAPDTVWVRIQDRGVGIPKKQLKRIFNRFYRVQTRTLKQVKGTGLGLYIVRSIARAHGGRVFAQSEGEGRGATFTLELPRLAS